MGLKWENIDFENNTISIAQANQYIPGKGTFTKEPKTETSVRTISVSEPVINLLKQHKTKQNEQQLKKGSLWNDTGFIFTQWNGLPMYPSTPSRWFSKFLAKNKLRKITFHQLRHTSASLLINENINIREISKRLGHSNTSTTLDIYGHALKSADKAAADKLGNILFPSNKDTQNEAK